MLLLLACLSLALCGNAILWLGLGVVTCASWQQAARSCYSCTAAPSPDAQAQVALRGVMGSESIGACLLCGAKCSLIAVHCFYSTPSSLMRGDQHRLKLPQSHLGQWSSYACLLMWRERARCLICCQMRLWTSCPARPDAPETPLTGRRCRACRCLSLQPACMHGLVCGYKKHVISKGGPWRPHKEHTQS